MSERERGGGGERDVNYRSSYGGGSGGGGRGSFRGRGGGGGFNKPRRYWDNDSYYKDDRDRGRRRRRSYSRSRSRSRSYSSRSRSRSRTPPPRRGRDSRSPRSPPPQHKPEEYVPRSTNAPSGGDISTHEPYVPSSTGPSTDAWGRPMTMSQTNGQAIANPYGNYSTPQYQENQGPLSSNNEAAMAYGYAHHNPAVPSLPMAPHHHYQQQQQYQATPADPRYPTQATAYPTAVSQPNIPPPPIISEKPPSAPQGETSSESSKKKKDKRKKKKRHHSSSSSSSSSDDDSSESRRRQKSKKDQSDSSSGEEMEKKKDTGSSAPAAGGGGTGLTTQQKEALLKQRESYQTKLDILEREISKLQSKEDELRKARVDRQLIEENIKLQAELTGRCKAVVIVLEKIDDVLRVGGKVAQAVGSASDKSKPSPSVTPAMPPSVSKSQTQMSAEPAKGISSDGQASFDYFDNKVHWCRLCNVFPQSMEQMLDHFHSKEHHDQIQQLGIDEKPWHKRSSGTDAIPAPGAKKVPFRGMQFFSPVQGWYCRLCNDWMGDPHCAEKHLKSQEHNSNYMGFLEEHPDWERKWVSDREKALDASGISTSVKQEMNKNASSSSRNEENTSRHQQQFQEEIDGGKSIRVQMRNALKGNDEKEQGGHFSQSAVSPRTEGKLEREKDSGLDEWIKKPKVTMDIIDTQKFAAIVRQKHGANKEKEGRASSREKEKDIEKEKEAKQAPAAPVISSGKEGSSRRGGFEDRRQRGEKVELQISSRDNKDRSSGGDRYNRDRDNRGSSRRRSSPRSRSRSRSPRDRRYGGGSRRRSRSRSPRSRSSERSDRGKDSSRNERDHHRDRPEFKETVKKQLPMIGKMPLYKRPFINKEKVEEKETKVESPVVKSAIPPPVGFLLKPPSFLNQQQEENRVSAMFNNSSRNNDNSTSNPPPSSYSYEAHSGFSNNSSQGYGMVAATAGSTSYGDHHHDQNSSSNDAVITGGQDSEYFQSEMAVDSPDNTEKVGVAEGKEKEGAAGGTALPDDFLQALDIIYAPPPQIQDGSGKEHGPRPVPAPGSNGDANGGSSDKMGGVSEYGTDYSANGYGSYMGYQPYQQSFDGYAPYDELDDGPPGVGDGPPGTAPVRLPPSVNVTMDSSSKKDQPQTERVLRDPPPPGADIDDMEDLRMLGIDVDDSAVVK